ncbi:hypothetical protein T8A63_07225 [Sulfitobacter sp. OXR-159]|uniref:hypothetical protein n=1 Tax=Sulfitobacter sp. OXR-159 TaxID=3100174 RepID=UPI002AC9492F|nr:hypothetical protein [Sulfitobacter sp. OXR-159]WPZ30746.1 hypothetical protein T8A63_06715 [Sulfitobacter sp. OXR-159]WPZ30847.1 hypothetical protein T8A63_07225 [Sulfitobacter sp. OXR-159]
MNTTGYRPAEEFARQATCTVCNGRERVCENHPGKAWPHECDCGAGMPCVCSPLHKHQPKQEQEGVMPFIESAHTSLVGALRSAPKVMPITVVSVDGTNKGQLVMFDGEKWSKSEVVKRLRAAADFLEAHL